MASFSTKTFTKHDDYLTPKSAWEAIKEYIPKKVIWEPFYGDGKSGQYLRDIVGVEVIHEDIDFFESDRGEIIVSNPPFSDTKNVLKRLKALGKPFILIMPSSKINTQYVRELFMDDKLQIIIPRKRIQFKKIVDGKEVASNNCNFDCFYYCWKIELEKDIVWLK